LKSVRTQFLDIGYLEAGSPDGHPVLLLHGWPDDVLTWQRVAPSLAEAGYRTFCPYLRGYGETRFVNPATPRSGQLSALGLDVIEFADALGLERFSVAGHDWGARAAYIAAALKPARVNSCVAISVGWGTNHPGQALALSQARNYWYHWFLATPRGEATLRDSRREFTKFLWSTWSPQWKFTDAEFEATAQSFDNPDWFAISLHSYRNRWGWAGGDPVYAAADRALNPAPVISVPTLVLHGEGDACNAPATSEGREAMFSGPYRREFVPGSGHFPQRENGPFVADAILGWLAKNSARSRE
jgi:pimeloyl-ACP methyl ester carboxylesterase